MTWRNSNSLTVAKRMSEELDCHQLIRLLGELCEHFLIHQMEIAPNPKSCLNMMRIMSWLMAMKQRTLTTNSKNHKRSATTILNSSPKHLYQKRTIQTKNPRRKNWGVRRSRFRRLNLEQYSYKIWVRRLKYAPMMHHHTCILTIVCPFLGIRMNKISFWVCEMRTPMQQIHPLWSTNSRKCRWWISSRSLLNLQPSQTKNCTGISFCKISRRLCKFRITKHSRRIKTCWRATKVLWTWAVQKYWIVVAFHKRTI